MTYTIKHNGAPVGEIKKLSGLAVRGGQRWYVHIEMPKAIRDYGAHTLASAKKLAANTVQTYSRERTFAEILDPIEAPQGVTFERKAA